METYQSDKYVAMVMEIAHSFYYAPNPTNSQRRNGYNTREFIIFSSVMYGGVVVS